MGSIAKSKADYVSVVGLYDIKEYYLAWKTLYSTAEDKYKEVFLKNLGDNKKALSKLQENGFVSENCTINFDNAQNFLSSKKSAGSAAKKVLKEKEAEETKVEMPKAEAPEASNERGM